MKKLIEQLSAHGYPTTFPLDGEWYRFDRTKPNSGYFKGLLIKVGDAQYAKASYGDWAAGEKYEYRSQEPSDAAEAAKVNDAYTAMMEEQKKLRAARAEQAALDAEKLWPTLSDRGSTPYMERKKIDSLYGARILAGESGLVLCVPCRDIDGKLWGIQKIYEDGTKAFAQNQKVKGVFHVIGNEDGIAGSIERDGRKQETIYVGEGYATCCSLHMSGAMPVVSAFNSGNIPHVCEALRAKYPDARIIVCADNDRWTTKPDGSPWNPGLEAAFDAAKRVGGEIRRPLFLEQPADWRGTDFNDEHCACGLGAVSESLAVELTRPEDADPRLGVRVKKIGDADDAKGESDSAKKKKEQEQNRLFFEATLRKFNEDFQYKTLARARTCYQWVGTHYQEMIDQKIENYAQTHLKPTADIKKRREFLSRIMINNMVEADWFNQSVDRHINFQNGVLNIDSGRLLPHSTEFGFRYVLPYDYNPDAKCPTYDAMMQRVTCGDKELETLLDEYMGYALSYDKMWVHKMLVLTGEGDNGKSTWLGVLSKLAGEGNYTPFFLKDFDKETNRQAMDGKLFNISSEMPKKGLMDTSIMKAMSSGDPVYVRALFKGPYMMRSRCKLLFACNELPDSADTTTGFFRRFIIVPFNAKFSKGDKDFDPKITEKLDAELSGIFNRALAGYLRMKSAGGFTEARAANSALGQYRMDSDSAATWIGENLVIDALTNPEPTHFSVLAEIYGDYAGAMDDNRIKPLSSVDFGRKLSKIIPDYKSRAVVKMVEGKSKRVLKNVTFRSRKDW